VYCIIIYVPTELTSKWVGHTTHFLLHIILGYKITSLLMPIVASRNRTSAKLDTVTRISRRNMHVTVIFASWICVWRNCKADLLITSVTNSTKQIPLLETNPSSATQWTVRNLCIPTARSQVHKSLPYRGKSSSYSEPHFNVKRHADAKVWDAFTD